MADNGLSSQEVEELNEIQRERLEVIESYGRVFGSVDGQRVLESLAYDCHETRHSYVMADPNTTIFNEGKRAVLMLIKARIDLSQNPQMLQQVVAKYKDTEADHE